MRSSVQKTFLIFSFIALSLIFVMTPVSAGVISDAPSLTQYLTNILKFLLSAAGVLGILSIAVSGIWYLVSAGDESNLERAKKMLLYSVVGLVVVAGALVIVRQILAFLS